ncbi:MBL fold metallo-hydrolase [Tabrizicola oligotrophica]|nr:MBL fold metallo-hydrolase [Tabrizicola oligotrophica]
MANWLRHVRAANASPMTGTGTNSWLVGRGQVAVIDPGPDDPAHLAALLGQLAPGEEIVAILVSHAHLDHTALVPRLAALTGAPVHAFGTAGDGRSPLMQRLATEGLQGGGEGVDLRFTPEHRLTDGQALTLGGFTIETLHTPGHMGGHLAFACEGLLFSGDHAMGWATSLVSPPDGDMGAYMASLDKLAARRWQRMLPGHGEAVENPGQRLAELATHRRTREAQVRAELARAPGTAAELAARIYTDTAPALLPAAARNVLAHLIDLSERMLAIPEGDIAAQTRFTAP